MLLKNNCRPNLITDCTSFGSNNCSHMLGITVNESLKSLCMNPWSMLLPQTITLNQHHVWLLVWCFCFYPRCNKNETFQNLLICLISQQNIFTKFLGNVFLVNLRRAFEFLLISSISLTMWNMQVWKIHTHIHKNCFKALYWKLFLGFVLTVFSAGQTKHVHKWGDRSAVERGGGKGEEEKHISPYSRPHRHGNVWG